MKLIGLDLRGGEGQIHRLHLDRLRNVIAGNQQITAENRSAEFGTVNISFQLHIDADSPRNRNAGCEGNTERRRKPSDLGNGDLTGLYP